MPRLPKKRWFGPDWEVRGDARKGGEKGNARYRICKEKGWRRRGGDAGVTVSRCRITYSISASDDDEDEG